MSESSNAPVRPRRRSRAPRLVDAAMRRLITFGGVTVVATVAGMLALILREALPLFAPARAETVVASPDAAVPENAVALFVTPDPRGERVAVGWLSPAGAGGVRRFAPGDASATARVVPVFPHPSGRTEVELVEGRPRRDGTVSLRWRDGALAAARLDAAAAFAPDGERPFVPVATDPGFGPARLGLLSGDETAGAAVAWLASGELRARRWWVERRGLRRIRSEAEGRLEIRAGFTPACLTASADGQRVWAGTASGEILAWTLPGATTAWSLLQAETTPANRDRAALTALALLPGERTLAVGDATGRVSAWHLGPAGELRKTADWPGRGVAVAALGTAATGRVLLALDADGNVRRMQTTTGALLSTCPAPAPALRNAFGVWALSADGIWLARREGPALAVRRIDDPHPEAGAAAFLKPLHYEGREKPAWIWQSTGAEDTEPKLSLVPLLFGTMKATLYAMLLATPLALLSALYVSQFAPPRLRGWIKPGVELMAAAPSVVVGFLAALWFAPLLESALLTLPLSALTMTGALLLFLARWRRLRRRWAWTRRVERGWEFAGAAVVLAAGFAAAWLLAGPLEAAWFGGDFPRWLYERAGLRYDQRNALVVAFALGFAMIPVVFSLAEDALSSVPPTLGAGALALGASRWQTAWRVGGPAAAPGLFAAVMIGFGRAVGETMIVLMATGNTPLLEFSPFNGMRTLSANIAVEMPEAPAGGTLYRTLFLCAVLLFIGTFLLNTAAEVVRRELARRHGRL